MNLIPEILILTAYLMGSIPFGYILTYKYTGQNIRNLGSGNIGSTNVKRVAGRKISIYTQLLDMLKGLIPVALTMISIKYQLIEDNEIIIYIVALSTIIGHDFSIFLKFKGGKGVNTTLGASVLFAPLQVIISVAFYYLIKLSTKYISLASITIGLVLVISEYLISGISNQFIYFIICFVLMVFQHRNNISRLIKGTENRV